MVSKENSLYLAQAGEVKGMETFGETVVLDGLGKIG